MNDEEEIEVIFPSKPIPKTPSPRLMKILVANLIEGDEMDHDTLTVVMLKRIIQNLPDEAEVYYMGCGTHDIGIGIWESK